jgi:hypothetical protein
MERNYTLCLSAALLLMAEELARSEKDADRKKKKERVVGLKRKLLIEAFPDATKGLSLIGDAHKLLGGDWSRQDALTFAIDLLFSNPFAPYELKVNNSDLDKALAMAVRYVGVSEEDVKHLRKTQREAFQVYQQINLAKVALIGVGGLIVMGLGGWAAAPLIGTAIGEAAGLAGAAATAHGLAILGGGSLAIGGAGMAGGLWMVTGTGAALGLLSSGGATLLLQIGAAAARQELIKLQVTFKEVSLGQQVAQAKAQNVISELVKNRDELRRILAEESKLNEKNSARLKQMATTLADMERTIKWMQEQNKKKGQG